MENLSAESVSLMYQALEYAKRGWPVIPLHNPTPYKNCSCGNVNCSSVAKHPRTKNGFKDASVRPITICNWWQQWPYANIAIKTGYESGLVVIDVDPRHGGDVSWRKFSEENNLGKTLEVRTGGGGFHLYYKSSDSKITNKTNILPGVDVRANGGYIIAAGSQHKTGNFYEWTNSESIIELPEDLRKLFNNEKAKEPSSTKEIISVGTRHTTLMSLGGLLRRQGFNSSHIYNALSAINKTLCAEPLGTQEIQSISNSLSKYEAVSSVEQNEWPEPSPLPEIKSIVPKMTPEYLPEALRSWTVDICDRMQIPLEFVAAPAIVSLSAVIGRQIGIYPKKKDDWLVIPNLWGAVIARPGFFKSPAIAEALKPLETLVRQERARYEAALIVAKSKEDVIKAKIEGIKENVKKTVRKGNAQEIEALEYQLADSIRELEDIQVSEKRYKTNDATIEKIGALLLENPKGILIFRDELSGWLRSLQKSGREGDREFFLEAWNGYGSYTIDRIGRGTLHIPALCLSIFGGLQPGKLDSYISQALYAGEGDDGLLQRFQLLVYPETMKTWRNVDRKANMESQKTVTELFQKLSTLGVKEENENMPGLRFSTNAQTVFNTWREALEIRLRKEECEAPAFESHLSKYRSMVPSLALIFHLCDNPKIDELSEVSKEAIELAIKWSEFLEAHAKKVYSGILHSEIKAAHALAKKIMSKAVTDKSTVRSVYRKCWSGLENSKQVDKALSFLEDLGWLRLVQVKINHGIKEEIHINPKLRA